MNDEALSAIRSLAVALVEVCDVAIARGAHHAVDQIAANMSDDVLQAVLDNLSGQDVLDLASHFGVTKSAIYLWKQNGIPPKRADAVREWFAQNGHTTTDVQADVEEAAE